MDNFFTSLSLANRLLQQKTTLLGTIIRNRWELPATAKEILGRQLYSTQVFTSGRAMLMVFATKKKKSVCLLSTMHQKVEIVDTQKQKPNTVVDYNHFKCAVDITDQKSRNYSVRAGTRRWPMTVYYNLLDMACTQHVQDPKEVANCSCWSLQRNFKTGFCRKRHKGKNTNRSVVT